MPVLFLTAQSKVVTCIAGFLILLLFLSSTPLAVRAADDAETTPPESVPAEVAVTIPVYSENNLPDGEADGADGTDATPEDITGGMATSSHFDVQIETGDASAGAELSTDANSNEVQSTLGTSTPIDLDTYTLSATGTNDSTVTNYGTSTALTGSNEALSDGDVEIATGDAVSVLNIANVINTNVINSNGFIALVNELVDSVLSWDLRDIFFPDDTIAPESTNSCSLVSCVAEDISYTIANTNSGDITNNANLDAVTGRNTGVGEVVLLDTGDAYGAANIINIANTNIIDSNYRLVTLNGIGTLDGDLVLPTEALFRAFFGQANGMNQVEDAEEVLLIDENENTAQVDTFLNTTAETGENNADTARPGSIITGKGSAVSNVVNEVNKNLFGGDSMYMLIRVHGAWNGNVFGLPEGLVWTETDEGIIISSEEAEIVPSEILHYDVDSYRAHFDNVNDIAIKNNISIDAISGSNVLEGATGTMRTGDAYAGANVLNVANTNVVGRNWILAIMNIFGDFNGNISFGRPDLWVGGQVHSVSSPVGRDSKLVYTYTITNKGDLTATDVKFSTDLRHAHIRYVDGDGDARAATNRDEFVGALLPGETKIISFDAYVDGDLPVGTSTVRSEARLSLRESDHDTANNRETISLDASYAVPVVIVQSGGGGGGGGGGKSKKPAKGKVLGATSDLSSRVIQPKTPPKISVEKMASVKFNQVVQAGEDVSYTVVVTNTGGRAYNTKVFDQLRNPIGVLVSEQFWDIGVLDAGEKVTLEYTIKFATNTPSGLYTNTARVESYRDSKGVKTLIPITDAVHTLTLHGQSQSVGNVGVTMFVPTGNGKSAALIAWETIKPASSQVFYGPTSTPSVYSATAPLYGYANSSYLSSYPTTSHYIVLTGLENGVTYSYRLRSANPESEIMSNEYSFTVPDVSLLTSL